MAVNYVQKVGDMLHLVNDNGTKIVAYPTSQEIWTLPEPVKPPDPDPDPDPEPGTGRFMWPFALSTVSSEYGPRNGRVHQGIDFGRGGVTTGTNIRAAGAGKVHQVGWHNNFGNRVVLIHPAVGSSGPLYTLYAHMVRASPVRQGQAIKRGQSIGAVGNTGASFGAHLHWETHVGRLGWSNPGPHINPRLFMQRYGG